MQATGVAVFLANQEITGVGCVVPDANFFFYFVTWKSTDFFILLREVQMGIRIMKIII